MIWKYSMAIQTAITCTRKVFKKEKENLTPLTPGSVILNSWGNDQLKVGRAKLGTRCWVITFSHFGKSEGVTECLLVTCLRQEIDYFLCLKLKSSEDTLSRSDVLRTLTIMGSELLEHIVIGHALTQSQGREFEKWNPIVNLYNMPASSWISN